MADTQNNTAPQYNEALFDSLGNAVTEGKDKQKVLTAETINNIITLIGNNADAANAADVFFCEAPRAEAAAAHEAALNATKTSVAAAHKAVIDKVLADGNAQYKLATTLKSFCESVEGCKAKLTADHTPAEVVADLGSLENVTA